MTDLLQSKRALQISGALALLSASSMASAQPSSVTARAELPYLRMSLVMNSSLHLVQLPLHLQGQLELSKARAFVSFGGGLVYAGAAGLTFATSRGLQHAGIYTFMGASIVGAGFVGYGLVRCASTDDPSCAGNVFNALNGLILANQIVAWTLGVRQLVSARDARLTAIARHIALIPRSDGALFHAVGTF